MAQLCVGVKPDTAEIPRLAREHRQAHHAPPETDEE